MAILKVLVDANANYNGVIVLKTATEQYTNMIVKNGDVVNFNDVEKIKDNIMNHCIIFYYGEKAGEEEIISKPVQENVANITQHTSDINKPEKEFEIKVEGDNDEILSAIEVKKDAEEDIKEDIKEDSKEDNNNKKKKPKPSDVF